MAPKRPPSFLRLRLVAPLLRLFVCVQGLYLDIFEGFVGPDLVFAVPPAFLAPSSRGWLVCYGGGGGGGLLSKGGMRAVELPSIEMWVAAVRGQKTWKVQSTSSGVLHTTVCSVLSPSIRSDTTVYRAILRSFFPPERKAPPKAYFPAVESNERLMEWGKRGTEQERTGEKGRERRSEQATKGRLEEMQCMRRKGRLVLRSTSYSPLFPKTVQYEWRHSSQLPLLSGFLHQQDPEVLCFVSRFRFHCSSFGNVSRTGTHRTLYSPQLRLSSKVRHVASGETKEHRQSSANV